MGTQFFVTVDGDRVEGPFDSRSEAKAVAAQRATNEVHLLFTVEAVTDDDEAPAH